MKPQELLSMYSDYFDKPYKQTQAIVMEDKLSRFTSEQLGVLYDRALERCRFLPKLAELFDIALDCGFLQTKQKAAALDGHDWSAVTTCGDCRGQGALLVFFTEASHVTAVFPLRSAAAQDYQANNPTLYRGVSRCSCARGDVDTLPTDWPKYGEPSRPFYRIDPKPGEDFRRVTELVREGEIPF